MSWYPQPRPPYSRVKFAPVHTGSGKCPAICSWFGSTLSLLQNNAQDILTGRNRGQQEECWSQRLFTHPSAQPVLLFHHQNRVPPSVPHSACPQRHPHSQLRQCILAVLTHTTGVGQAGSGESQATHPALGFSQGHQARLQSQSS